MDGSRERKRWREVGSEGCVHVRVRVRVCVCVCV